MRLPGRRARLIAVGAFVAAAGCVGAGLARPADPPAPGGPAAAVETVGHRVLVCPGDGTANRRGAASTVTTATPPDAVVRGVAAAAGATTSSDPGVAVVEGLSGLGPTYGALNAPGTTLGVTTEPVLPPGSPNPDGAKVAKPGPATEGQRDADRAGAATVNATGDLAPGIASVQTTNDKRPLSRGIRMTRCVEPGASAWFVGGSGGVGRRTSVILSNPDSTAAVADIDLITEDGSSQTGATRGIVVAPHGRYELRLDTVIPGGRYAVVHVVVRNGRAAAAVQDVWVRGTQSIGTAWVPMAAAPSRSVVVPGVLAGGGERTLLLAAPGGQDAVASVAIVSPATTFVPEPLAVLPITGGQVLAVDIGRFVTEETTSLLVTSDVPVVAGVEQVVSGGKAAGGKAALSDTAYAAGSDEVRQPTVVPGLPVGAGFVTRLVLTAPHGDASAVVTVSGAVQREQVVNIDGGTSTAVSVSTGTEPFGWAALLVQPGSGAIVAAVQTGRLHAEGWAVASFPLVSPRYLLRLPPVQPDPANGLPGH